MKRCLYFLGWRSVPVMIVLGVGKEVALSLWAHFHSLPNSRSSAAWPHHASLPLGPPKTSQVSNPMETFQPWSSVSLWLRWHCWPLCWPHSSLLPPLPGGHAFRFFSCNSSSSSSAFFPTSLGVCFPKVLSSALSDSAPFSWAATWLQSYLWISNCTCFLKAPGIYALKASIATAFNFGCTLESWPLLKKYPCLSFTIRAIDLIDPNESRTWLFLNASR